MASARSERRAAARKRISPRSGRGRGGPARQRGAGGSDGGQQLLRAALRRARHDHVGPRRVVSVPHLAGLGPGAADEMRHVDGRVVG